MKSNLGKIIRFAISFGAIGLVLYSVRGKLHESWAILRHDVLWGWFATAIVTYFIALAVLAVRLQWVFRVQNILVTFRESFYLGFVGLFYNLMLPSAVGGDLAKAFYAYKHSGKKIESLTSVLLDRILGFVALIIMAILGLWYFSKEVQSPYVNYSVYGAFGFLTFFAVFFWSKRFAKLFRWALILVPGEKMKNRFREIYHAIYGYRHHRGPVAVAILLSFLGQCLFVTTHYWLALSLGADIIFWKFFILVPVISIVSMAPSLGGLGVREASALYLFSRYLTTERALALTLLVDLLIYIFSIGSGILYAFKGGLGQTDKAEMEMMKSSV